MRKILIVCAAAVLLFFVVMAIQLQKAEKTVAYAAGDDDFRLVISTDDGVLLVDRGGAEVGFISESGAVEIFEHRIFVLGFRTIWEYDADGTLHNTITLPEEVVYKSGFAVLPGLNFALFDNDNDTIYFINYEGTYLTTVYIHPEPDASLQNTDGVVVGNSLFLSENGNMQIVEINLTSYEATIFKTFPFLSEWLGAIDYSDDVFYVCRMQDVLSFRENQFGKTVVAILPEGNISGIVVDGLTAFVTVNRGGILYRLNILTGAFEELLTGLNYPDDIEKMSLGIDTSTTTTASDSDCVAAVLYGKNFEMLVNVRSFRDDILSQTSGGKELIKLYYLLSPALVKLMEQDEDFKAGVKETVDEILEMMGIGVK